MPPVARFGFTASAARAVTMPVIVTTLSFFSRSIAAKAGPDTSGHDLGDAVMVAQVDEDQIAMVALLVDPARHADFPADIGRAQGGGNCECDRRAWGYRSWAGASLPTPALSRRATPRYGCADAHPSLITDSDTLADLCTRLAKADFVTVDTEFMRESTFYPELCLIQIADTNEAAAIDPMAKGLDLGPLLALLTDNEDVLKVFHAAVRISRSSTT